LLIAALLSSNLSTLLNALKLPRVDKLLNSISNANSGDIVETTKPPQPIEVIVQNPHDQRVLPPLPLSDSVPKNLTTHVATLPATIPTALVSESVVLPVVEAPKIESSSSSESDSDDENDTSETSGSDDSDNDMEESSLANRLGTAAQTPRVVKKREVEPEVPKSEPPVNDQSMTPAIESDSDSDSNNDMDSASSSGDSGSESESESEKEAEKVVTVAAMDSQIDHMLAVADSQATTMDVDPSSHENDNESETNSSSESDTESSSGSESESGSDSNSSGVSQESPMETLRFNKDIVKTPAVKPVNTRALSALKVCHVFCSMICLH
jgi:hypothetical protein